jgi:hypothetical protein
MGNPTGILAAGEGADVTLALVPKGSGAIIAAVPDGTIAGGNARGANATDLQTVRNAATQVASGANAALIGGTNNTASGAEAIVGGGAGNTASGSRAAVLGGAGNTADATNAWVPGGERATTRSTVGRGAWSAGRFTVNGDAQSGEFSLRIQTSDATAQRLTATTGAPSGTNTVNLPNNGTYRVKVFVVAQQTGGTAGTVGDCASWEADVLIRRGANAAATAIVAIRTINDTPALAAVTAGTPFTPGQRDAGAAAWTLTLAADTTNGGLAVTGTGEANKTIRWVARVQSVEVTA